MHKIIKIQIILFLVCFSSFSCKQTTHAQSSIKPRSLTQQFKTYWYAGLAEISSYELSENRYGEVRNGKAALIYVTEDFVPQKQVKADQNNPDNISVLKLNSVKKFITGIYPYSVMQSTFLPLQVNDNAIKITASVQEWCGQTFIQLNNKKDFEISAFSYFESEGDQQLNLPKTLTENELWNLIRLEGLKNLPNGEINLIPSFEFIRMSHSKIKAYKAKISNSIENGLVSYTINYPELNRTLKIDFQEKAPFIIEGWTEQIGNKTPSIAKRIATKKLPYWNLKSKKDEILRHELGL